MPRLIDFVKRLEGPVQYGRLLVPVAGFPQGVPEGPAQKNGSRRFYFFGVLAHDGDADGGDAGLLNRPLDQSDGLIADASGRGQKDGVHAIFKEHAGNLRSCSLDQCLDVRTVDMAHE